jgi:hypothetical protein
VAVGKTPVITPACLQKLLGLCATECGMCEEEFRGAKAQEFKSSSVQRLRD